MCAVDEKAKNDHQILILQEEEAVVHVLTYQLHQIGFSVTVAADVQEAYEAMKLHGPFQAVILEMMIRGMSVFDFTDWCLHHSKWKSLKVFFLTYYNITSALRKRLHHERVFYFQKPVDTRELLDTIQASVSWY